MPRNETPDNRQNLPRISMIATPIGNLADLSQRAIETLRSVDELWCEDTRHTQMLLNALKIEGKRLRRVDQHLNRDEIVRLLERVELTRQWVGVVTDAGTPGLSDPGALIAQVIIDFPGIKLEPIPGPSALLALVSISGFSGSSLLFHGFFPRAQRDAVELLIKLKKGAASPNWIFFESPHRILDTLSVLESWCREQGVEPDFVFAKELTKMHESVFRGRGPDFLKGLREQPVDERGEWVFSMVLSKDCLVNDAPEGEWVLALQCLIEAGITAKSASQIIASRFSVARNLAYKQALEFQNK